MHKVKKRLFEKRTEKKGEKKATFFLKKTKKTINVAPEKKYKINE